MQKLDKVFIGFSLWIYFFGMWALLLFSSCHSYQSYSYFKDLKKDTIIEKYVSPAYESKIQVNDVLGVSVSSLNRELDEQFNGVSKIAGAQNEKTAQAGLGFRVDEAGFVYLHFLGKIKVEGLTRNELKKKLEKELAAYLKEPIVTVQYLSKKVTVLGNVKTPGIQMLNEEQVPLLQVLVNCGDLSDLSLANDILVIRDSSDQKIVKHINLEDHSVFNSPWYYSRSEDIIYVKKNNSQYDKDQRRKDLQSTITLTVSLTSLLLVVINTLFK